MKILDIDHNIDNQPSEIKDGINNQPSSVRDRKISDATKFKFRDANSNEIKELNYLVDYINNSIEKYIEYIFVHTRSTKHGKLIYKNYNFSNYTNLWLLVKKYLKENYQ